MKFEEVLRVDLAITLAGRRYVIGAEDVCHVALDLRGAGFAGLVEFVARDDASYGGQYQDELAAAFLNPDDLEVEVSVLPARQSAETDTAMEPISVTGRACHRSLQEEATDWSAERPLLWRRYRVEFGDPARILWRRHFPCDLLRDQSLLDVVNAQAPADVSVSSSLSAAEESRRQWFLHLPEQGGASFYDFLCWYLDDRGGRLLYDYDGKSYELTAEASKTGQTQNLFGDDIAEVNLSLPEPNRSQPRVRNSFANAAETVAPEVEQTLSPLVCDVLMRTAIAEQQSARADEVKLRAAVPLPRVELSFKRYPSARLVPGCVVACPPEARFSKASALASGEWVVRSVRLEGHRKPGATGGKLGPEAVPMTVDLSAVLGRSEDRTVTGWPFVAPSYPGFVEGKVLSQQGEDTDSTWDSTQNEDTALDEMEVQVPVFDCTVFVPFEPGLLGESVYLPHCRGARVLLALELEESCIVRTLSWRQGAPAAKEGQGERLVFGKSEESNTKLTHLYEDSSPVFGVLRVHDKDQVALTFSEGKLVLGVEESG